MNKLFRAVYVLAVLFTVVELALARNVVDCYQMCLDYCIVPYGDNEDSMNICMNGCLYACESRCP